MRTLAKRSKSTAATVKSAIAQGASDEGCQAAFAHALLASEHAHDPSLLYRQLYSSAKVFAGSVCESAFSDALSAMLAYRPGKEVLAALDQEADTKRAGVGSSAAVSAAPAGEVSTDEAGVVVTPSVVSGAGLVKVVAIGPTDRRTERGSW